MQKDLENVRKELDLVEDRETKSTDLEKFLARQIEELRGELECPVCLEVVTTAPIYKCDDDHLICRYWSSQESEDVLQKYFLRECQPKLEECPQCREAYPEKVKR